MIANINVKKNTACWAVFFFITTFDNECDLVLWVWNEHSFMKRFQYAVFSRTCSFIFTEIAVKTCYVKLFYRCAVQDYGTIPAEIRR